MAASDPPRPRRASFLAFFLVWARVQRWKVPDLHLRMVLWLDVTDDPVRVLMVFRGAAKSTIYAVYKAYCLWENNQLRSLIWAANDKLANRLTRDTLNVLRRHPWCGGMLMGKPGSRMFWVAGALDARNPSMEANGVNSNAVGNRDDAIDFDDIEVPKNIKTAEMRENLRLRIEESTHILVPGGQETYIGTPHTHNSIYTEMIEAGAASLKIPLFESSVRFEDPVRREFDVAFDAGPDGYYVFTGIGKFAKLLVEGVDFERRGRTFVFARAPGVLLDIYAHCAWPDRFTRTDIAKRRRRTRTINGWDSQYMLEAKPITEVRLDPDRMRIYDVEPAITFANHQVMMMLGRRQIVSARLRLDPSSAKLKSDVSALCLILYDEIGTIYWHRAMALSGEVANFSDQGQIDGGQVEQICDVIRDFHLTRVDVETNGLGTHVPAVLRGALKRRKMRCAVIADEVKGNKNADILAGLETPLRSGYLWAHTSVLAAIEDQMRDWKPDVTDQPDDYLDCGARAILAEPVRIGQRVIEIATARTEKIVGIPTGVSPDDWRPSTGVYEVTLDWSPGRR